VLRNGRDDMVALSPIHAGDPAESEVVAFRGAAGKDNLARLGANELSHLLTCPIDRVLGFPAEGMMPAGGVAVALAEVRQHRLQNARIDPRRRVVVHENRKMDHVFILTIGLIEWDGC